MYIKIFFYVCCLFFSIVHAEEESIPENNLSAKAIDKSKLAKVAVTDITYKKELSQKISYINHYEKADIQAKGKISEHESSSRNHYSYSRNQTLGDTKVDSNSGVVSGEQEIAYLRVGELRSLTGDIKSEMIKSGAFRLSQGKPYTARDSEDIYDVIKRIKAGYYPGADYVLFGALIDIQGSNDYSNIQGSDATMVGVRLELAAEFNLINTKTYEVISAFSASGEGADVRVLKPGTAFTPSRVKAIKEVSKSLAEDVINQMLEQIPDGAVKTKHKSRG